MKSGHINSRFFKRNAGANANAEPEPDINADAKKVALIALCVVLLELCVIIVLKTTNEVPQSAMGLDNRTGQVGCSSQGLDLETGPYDLNKSPGPDKPRQIKKSGKVPGDTAGKEPVSSGLITSGADKVENPELLSVWDTIGQNIHMVRPPARQDWRSPFKPPYN